LAYSQLVILNEVKDPLAKGGDSSVAEKMLPQSDK